jgi:transcriptional regulator with XRE-family HTH domain
VPIVIGVATSDLGRRIQQRRKTVGLTQRQLADKLGLDVGTISRLERGISGNLHTYTAAADALDLDLFADEVAS